MAAKEEGWATNGVRKTLHRCIIHFDVLQVADDARLQGQDVCWLLAHCRLSSRSLRCRPVVTDMPKQATGDSLRYKTSP